MADAAGQNGGRKRPSGQFRPPVDNMGRIKSGDVHTAVMAGKAAGTDWKLGTVMDILLELFSRLIMTRRTRDVFMMTPGNATKSRRYK